MQKPKCTLACVCTACLPPGRLLPIAALLLAGSLGISKTAQAQSEGGTLRTVTVKDQQDASTSKNTVLLKETSIAKGKQKLKDIPQTVTVMSEKLLADRNLDDLREVLKTTAGVTFQAGETGEEDVRMRGFSLGQAGDIYVDGLRDAPLIEHDTFNIDRVEILKGSASMLFGKGSTGGVINQVNKQPFLLEQSETNVSVGDAQMLRMTADLNKPTGQSSALRLNLMRHTANNAGARVDKKGIAPSYRWGIGERNEYAVSLYQLETDGRPLYNHPWFLSGGNRGSIVTALPAENYYGLSSDYLRTQSSCVTFTHQHRLDSASALKTTLRHGHYERDLLASAVRFGSTNGVSTTIDNWDDNTVITRTLKARRAESDLTQIQTDYTRNFDWLGRAHSLITGIDYSHENALRNNSATAGLPSTAGLSTTVGTPNDGKSIVDTRQVALNNFRTRNLGIYAQDTMRLTPEVKLVAGVRVDHFSADYADTSGNTLARSDNLWSPRIGAAWQPNAHASYYTSFGTSYNTSGDTYQYALGSYAAGSSNAKAANTPPEKSRNIEVGAKFEVFEQKALWGVALFHSEKYNERNTDPDSAAAQMLLSGKRHALGMEFNFAGRITPAWEVFYNHTWIPDARIDESNQTPNLSGTGAQVEGDRPALTPLHSASLWNTYRFNGMWRAGLGLNYRGEQNPDGARHVLAPAVTTMDAMAEWTLSDANVLKLNVSNLTNQLYADTLYRGFYGPGAPRRVELNWKFLF